MGLIQNTDGSNISYAIIQLRTDFIPTLNSPNLNDYLHNTMRCLA